MVDVRSAHWQQSSKYDSCLLDCSALAADSLTDRPENCSNCHQHETLIRFDVPMTIRPCPNWKQKKKKKTTKRKCAIALGLEPAMREPYSLLAAWNCVITDGCSKWVAPAAALERKTTGTGHWTWRRFTNPELKRCHANGMKSYHFTNLIDRLGNDDNDDDNVDHPWSVIENVNGRTRVIQDADSTRISVGSIRVQLLFTVNGIMQ